MIPSEPPRGVPRPPRIEGAAAHIVVALHDFPAGGSERIAIRLANRWAACGRRVTIVCGDEAGPARALVGAGIAVQAVRPAIPRSVFSRLRLGRALAHPLRSLRPDVVFAPGNFHLPVLRAMAGTLGDTRPVIACKLSNPLARPDRGTVAHHAFALRSRFLADAVDLLVAMSPALRDDARRVLRRDDIACIAEPNFDDDTVFGPATPANGTALCIGRLVPQKRIDLALRAFALVPPATAATLTIIGDGPERDALVAETARLGIADRVTFVGHVASVAPYLAHAGLLLCTSRYEGYPAVLVEALAARVPVVTTACSPAIGEIMAHPSFGIVAAGTPAALAGAIAAQLARARPDAAACATLVDAHRIGPVARKYLALFDQTVAARAGG